MRQLSQARRPRFQTALPRAEAEICAEAEPAYDLIELFFFAYRDYVADADKILAGLGLGRAHHRVLHFVARRPGLSVADLLCLLGITKQSLARVLRSLVEAGFVEQRTGTSDRRQRHLFATETGDALAQRLALIQTRRLRRAARDGASEDAARRFLEAVRGPSREWAIREEQPS